MQYRTLGRTGVQVSTLVLGAMNFGSQGRTTQDEVTGMVDAGSDESRGGRVQQCLLVTPGVGPLPRG